MKIDKAVAERICEGFAILLNGDIIDMFCDLGESSKSLGENDVILQFQQGGKKAEESHNELLESVYKPIVNEFNAQLELEGVFSKFQGANVTGASAAGTIEAMDLGKLNSLGLQ